MLTATILVAILFTPLGLLDLIKGEMDNWLFLLTIFILVILQLTTRPLPLLTLVLFDIILFVFFFLMRKLDLIGDADILIPLSLPFLVPPITLKGVILGLIAVIPAYIIHIIRIRGATCRFSITKPVLVKGVEKTKKAWYIIPRNTSINLETEEILKIKNEWKPDQCYEVIVALPMLWFWGVFYTTTVFTSLF